MGATIGPEDDMLLDESAPLKSVYPYRQIQTLVEQVMHIVTTNHDMERSLILTAFLHYTPHVTYKYSMPLDPKMS